MQAHHHGLLSHSLEQEWQSAWLTFPRISLGRVLFRVWKFLFLVVVWILLACGLVVGWFLFSRLLLLLLLLFLLCEVEQFHGFGLFVCEIEQLVFFLVLLGVFLAFACLDPGLARFFSWDLMHLVAKF